MPTFCVVAVLPNKMGERNRHTLDTLIGYSFEHGLIKQRFGVDDLFLPLDQGRKRGGYRI